MKKETKTKVKKAMTIEDLAMITQKGFAGIESRMATKDELALVKQDVSLMKEEISLIKEDFSSIKQRVSSIEEEQKETNRRLASIEKKQIGTVLSLDETVHRSEFEVVVRRVEVLEKSK